MEPIVIAVCDDELPALEQIQNGITGLFTSYQIKARVSAFTSAEKLKQSMLQIHFSAFFLDIDMPEMNGIELASDIRRLYPDTPLIFISALEEYVFASFRVHPFAFVRKNKLDEDLPNALRDLISLFSRKNEQYPVVLTDELGHHIRTDACDILYVEVKDKYVQIYTPEEKILLRSSLKEMEKQLPENYFFRCHKSYLVNIRKIYSIRFDHIVLTDKTTLPLRRGSAMELKRSLSDYLGSLGAADKNRRQ